MKIAVIAGAFDPIHLGHLHFINETIKNYNLNKVYLLIEKDSKHKKIFASYKDRKTMVELAISNHPQLEIYNDQSLYFPISNSLPKIIKDNPGSNVYLLIGSDVAEHINDWQDAETLFKDVKFIIAKRGSGDKHRSFRSGQIRDEIKQSIQSTGLNDKVYRYIKKTKLYM